jgi:hypothetical protein
MHGLGRLVSTLAAVVMAVTAAASGSLGAEAAKLPQPTSQVQYRSADGSLLVLVPRQGISKSAWTPQVDVAAFGAKVVPLTSCGWPNCRPATLSNTITPLITPPGGARGTWYLSFSTSAPYCYPETCVTFNGSSTVRWLGYSPYNMSEMKLTDHWHVDGVGLSASLPAGVGVSGSAGDGYWTTSIANNWALYHNYNNEYFTGLAMWNISDTATGESDLGSWAYRNSTYASALI